MILLRRWIATVVAIALWVSCAVSAAQAKPDVRVSALTFVGNQAFDDGMLRGVIQTRKASRWPWADWVPFDQRRLDADVSRLRAFHVDHGFPEVRVRLDEVALAPDGRSIRIRIAIDEGPPLMVTDVTVEGFDVPNLPLKAGDRRDSAQLIRARDVVLGAMREQGHPYARVTIEERAVSPGAVALRIVADPGPQARFGALTTNGLMRAKQVIIRRAVTFKPGQPYSESEVIRSQRRLAGIQAFEFVNLAPDAAARDAKATELPMIVTVTEAKRQRYEIGVGYGTEERMRGTFEWRNVNVAGNGSQLVANAKYSAVLRGVTVGYEHPYLLRSGGTLSAQAGARRRYEPTFESQSAGGSIAVRHELGRANRARAGVSGWEATGTYRNERLTYRVKDAALADLGSIEDRIALGLDPVTGRGDGTIAGLEFDVSRRALDGPTDPVRGTTLAVHMAHVAPWLGGTFRFDELAGEVRGYVPVRGRLRLAARLRAGTLLAADDTEIPFSERYFLGGSTSVRGWGRFQVSPVSDSGVPIGGRNVVEGAVEIRFPLVGLVGGVVFLDAGHVGSEPWAFRSSDVRYAAGGGLRYASLIGVVRADIGFQLNPIAGLRVNGNPQPHSWRIHLSIGHAF